MGLDTTHGNTPQVSKKSGITTYGFALNGGLGDVFHGWVPPKEGIVSGVLSFRSYKDYHKILDYIADHYFDTNVLTFRYLQTIKSPYKLYLIADGKIIHDLCFRAKIHATNEWTWVEDPKPSPTVDHVYRPANPKELYRLKSIANQRIEDGKIVSITVYPEKIKISATESEHTNFKNECTMMGAKWIMEW